MSTMHIPEQIASIKSKLTELGCLYARTDMYSKIDADINNMLANINSQLNIIIQARKE